MNGPARAICRVGGNPRHHRPHRSRRMRGTRSGARRCAPGHLPCAPMVAGGRAVSRGASVSQSPGAPGGAPRRLGSHRRPSVPARGPRSHVSGPPRHRRSGTDSWIIGSCGDTFAPWPGSSSRPSRARSRSSSAQVAAVSVWVRQRASRSSQTRTHSEGPAMISTASATASPCARMKRRASDNIACRSQTERMGSGSITDIRVVPQLSRRARLRPRQVKGATSERFARPQCGSVLPPTDAAALSRWEIPDLTTNEIVMGELSWSSPSARELDTDWASLLHSRMGKMHTVSRKSRLSHKGPQTERRFLFGDLRADVGTIHILAGGSIRTAWRELSACRRLRK